MAKNKERKNKRSCLIIAYIYKIQNKEDYLKTVRPKFGIISYDAMLTFASDCVNFVPEVVMTVVDKVTTKEEQELSRKICEEIGVTLRVRPYEEN